MAYWVDILDDRCKCKWINTRDDGGWNMKWRNPDCCIHGNNPTVFDAR